jgi:O-antigen ligase
VIESSAAAGDRLALRVVQVGAVATVLAALPFKPFDLDRFFVPKELVLVVTATLAGAILLAGAREIRLTRVDTLLAAFLALSVASAAGATNHWLAWRAVAVSAAGLTLYWVGGALARAGLARGVLAGVGLAAVAGSATALAQAYGAHSDFLSLNRAPGGTLGNRNFIAHLAAVGLPVLVLSAAGARRLSGFALGAAGCTIVAWALVLSRTRAAYLAAAVVTVLAVLIVMRAPGRWGGIATGWRIFVLTACGIAGAALAVTLPNTLHWKSRNPYLDSAIGVADFREGSGHGRLVQWRNSLRMAAAHPVTGVGPGNWPVVYPRYASPHDPSLDEESGMTDNPWPSSDWVAFVSERGAAATACLALAMLGLVVTAVRALPGPGAAGTGGLASLALIATVIAAVVVGAFDAVLLLPTPSALIWPALGALAPPTAARVTWPFPRVLRLGAAAALLLVGVAGAARSVTQAMAMALYGDGVRAAAVTRAARLDPGSYRIRTRLAESDLRRGRCTGVRRNAGEAHRLFPNAPTPRRLLAACGSRVDAASE